MDGGGQVHKEHTAARRAGVSDSTRWWRAARCTRRHPGRGRRALRPSRDPRRHCQRRELERVSANQGLGLTGLANRRYFLGRGRARRQRAERHGQALSLLTSTFDHFNDQRRARPPGGRRRAVPVSERTRSSLRNEDMPARAGRRGVRGARRADTALAQGDAGGEPPARRDRGHAWAPTCAGPLPVTCSGGGIAQRRPGGGSPRSSRAPTPRSTRRRIPGATRAWPRRWSKVRAQGIS